MSKDDAFTQFERDMGRRSPRPSHGTPWIGTEVEQDGEVTGAYPGTGTSLPQDIGAAGFQVEEPPDEDRDDLSMIATAEENMTPADEFDFPDLDLRPAIEGTDEKLSTALADRPSRVDRIDEDETPLDEGDAGEMSESAELSELPIGAENVTAGELGRYECPNCGHVYDVVVGTRARCPNCQYEAELATIIGDEAFHHSVGAAELDE